MCYNNNSLCTEVNENQGGEETLQIYWIPHNNREIKFDSYLLVQSPNILPARTTTVSNIPPTSHPFTKVVSIENFWGGVGSDY